MTFHLLLTKYLPCYFTAFAICVSLPYFESFGTYSIKLLFPFAFSVYFPYILKAYLLVLFIGKCLIFRKLRLNTACMPMATKIKSVRILSQTVTLCHVCTPLQESSSPSILISDVIKIQNKNIKIAFCYINFHLIIPSFCQPLLSRSF